MRITIEATGTIRFIWTDDMVDLSKEGTCTIRRASRVEPTEDGEWTADMSPVHGPVLGPYPTRGAALEAEVAWLEGKGF